MEDVVLPPTSRSVSEFERALKGVVVRYERDNEPVKYDQVRGIPSTNSSSCLKFFGNIGVLEIEKQGTYIPTSSAIDLFSDNRETQKSGLQDLHNILSDSDLFDEISFIVENYDFTVEEIADELVDDVESDGGSDDEDIADGIELFIKIFEDLGLFEIDEDGRVQMVSMDEEVNTESEDSSNIEQVSDGSGAEQVGQNSVNHNHPNSAESSFSVTEFDVKVTVPPARTDPRKLHRICSVIKDAGEVSVDDLESDEELDLSEQYIQHSLEYGKVLGFIKELSDGDGYELTESGYDLGYRTDISETGELFREGLLKSPEFRSVVSEWIGDTSVKNDGYIAMETALRIYRAKFGLTDAGEDRLERGVRTLFKTLEMAEYGEYKRGGSEHPTRLRLNSIDTLQQDIQPDPPTGNEEMEPEVNSSMPESEGKEADNQEIAPEKTMNSPDDSKDSEPVPEQVSQDQEVHDTTGTHREAVVNIDIELDLSEIDTNELEQKLSAIDAFLEGSDYNT